MNDVPDGGASDDLRNEITGGQGGREGKGEEVEGDGCPRSTHVIIPLHLPHQLTLVISHADNHCFRLATVFNRFQSISLSLRWTTRLNRRWASPFFTFVPIADRKGDRFPVAAFWRRRRSLGTLQSGGL